MKSILEVSSLILLAIVGASTSVGAQRQGPGRQQQQQQDGQTTRRRNGPGKNSINRILDQPTTNGMDSNMVMMMMMMMLPPSVPNSGGGSASRKLKNATDCGEGEHPWLCTFYRKDGTWFGCSGTIINCEPTIIVSAAHCFKKDSPHKVTCGDWMIDGTDTFEQSREIREIIQHPSFDGTTFQNDIAVIEVHGKRLCSRGKIRPACLPNTARYTYEGWVDTLVSGWGNISSGVTSNRAHAAVVPPVPDATCNAANIYDGIIVSDQMICAGNEGWQNVDACHGERGSPLVTRATEVDSGSKNGYSLIGILSFGDRCADFYGVYTEFSNYMEWVAEQFGLTLE